MILVRTVDGRTYQIDAETFRNMVEKVGESGRCRDQFIFITGRTTQAGYEETTAMISLDHIVAFEGVPLA